VAYNSSRSGRLEVYIAAFPSFEQEQQVSNNGGLDARWRNDGEELFYASPAGMMSVDVKRGPRLVTSAPRVLFKTPFEINSFSQYAVTGDGQRFIILEPVDEATQPFTVVLNWTAGLKR
jgi:hypothetical protein